MIAFFLNDKAKEISAWQKSKNILIQEKLKEIFHSDLTKAEENKSNRRI